MTDNTVPPDNSGRDPLESWLNQQVKPLPPPPGTFELITRRARRRRLRRVAVTATSAAAVAAVVAVAAANPTLLHLSTPSESGQVAAGARTSRSPSPGTGIQQPNGSGRLASPAPSPSSPAGAKQPAFGPVPADFAPSSVTFVSPTRAWVIGQAGVPGSCYNGSICTSVAWTSDGGDTWHGEHAPVAGAPDGSAGVSGVRFLDGVNGWAFGPELWATHDGGVHWRHVATSGQRVTDLEAVGGRAYALFANCPGDSGSSFAADCTSYTLMTAAAGGDNWTPAGTATNDLGASGGSAMLELTGSAGYLLAPDGTLYSGPIGGAWSKADAAPCRPGPPQPDGVPSGALLAVQDSAHLALACASASSGGPPAVYASSDGGASWTQRPAAAWSTISGIGTVTSFAAAPGGTLVLATSKGLWTLPSGSANWQAATASGGGDLPSGGFSYAGMTSDSRGVALPQDTSRHEIWVTADGGRTWTPKPVS